MLHLVLYGDTITWTQVVPILLTRSQLNCLSLVFIHLKLKFITQFHLQIIFFFTIYGTGHISNCKNMNNRISQLFFINFSGILFGLKIA